MAHAGGLQGSQPRLLRMVEDVVGINELEGVVRPTK